jgi:iron complex transport system permease protein
MLGGKLKVTLDIDQLLGEGRISAEEYARLKELAGEATVSLGINLVVAFGVAMAAGGLIAWLRSAPLIIALGMVVFGGAVYIYVRHQRAWLLLGQVLAPLGALVAGGGVVVLTDGSWKGLAVVTCTLAVAALVVRNYPLAALTPIALLSTLGGFAGYADAAYYLCIQRPTLTVGVFIPLAVLSRATAKRIGGDYSRLAVVTSRAAVVVANFGFWVGSLWGAEYDFRSSSAWYFIIGWAVALVIAGICAVRLKDRWLLITLAVFAGVHLYTQWFEHAGASPASVAVAGLAAIFIGCGAIVYRRRKRGHVTAVSAGRPS